VLHPNVTRPRHEQDGARWHVGRGDGFYYDVLWHPDGRATRLKVRSMVGLLPLCATTVIEPWQRERVPGVVAMFQERLRRMPTLLEGIGLPVAMERKLALRKSAALRECHWDGVTRPSELILELQVTANQHIRVVCGKKSGEIYFLTSTRGAYLLLSKEVSRHQVVSFRLLHL
jgi:hypothetical protein